MMEARLKAQIEDLRSRSVGPALDLCRCGHVRADHPQVCDVIHRQIRVTACDLCDCRAFEAAQLALEIEDA